MSPAPTGRGLRTGLLAAAILLLVLEIAARFLGPALKTPPYTYLAAGHEEYFGTARVSIPYEAHRPYYWLPRPGAPLINRQGFRGRDWPEPKAPGVTRIICLGCSCTLGGQEPYPQRLERLLAEAGLPGRYEVLNAGVGSSSTHQLLQILDRHLLQRAPDVLVVYSGWNDLAVHDGRRDARHRLPAPWQQRLQAFLQPSHLYRLMGHLAGRPARQHPEQRVPVAAYEENLRRLVAMGRQQGARVVLCTFVDGLDPRVIARRATRQPGPHDWAHDFYRVYLPYSADPQAQWRLAVSQYHGAVRAVAAQPGAELADLATALTARATSGLPLLKDGIHFTEYGHQQVALQLARKILPPESVPTIDRYADSPAYFLTNASVFASQFQFAAAAHFLDRAGLDPHPLRALIERERPFYDRYEVARAELSNGGDAERAARLLEVCLEERPDNHDLRIDLAEVAAQAGQPARAIDIALGAPRPYDPAQAHRALWVGARAARDLGRRDLALRLLRELTQHYPDDPLAAAALREITGR
jgi:lysophospholipase L1-like esterase